MKKANRQLLLVIFTLVFLICLVIIQVNWILRAAKMQEAQFSQSVKMALIRAERNISQDAQICVGMSSCFITNPNICVRESREIEWSKVDSILKKDLEYYNIDLEYEFDIVNVNDPLQTKKINEFIDGSHYTQSLEQALQYAGIQLKVKFPGKKEFILAQIGAIFITSILLIILTSISFIIILNTYRKEKRLAEKTRDFINNITHEFKTPLTNIDFANNMIKKDKNFTASEKIKRYTGIINDENLKLKDHVDELLQIAVLESSGNKNEHKEFSLHELTDNAIKAFELRIRDRGGIISREYNADKDIIRGNKAYMLNTISNLIDNACKYTNGSPQVKIKTCNKENNIIIEITDNGIGISNEHQKYIFDKYYRVQTGDVHNVKGFGLGLSYVEMAVNEFGGKVHLKSEKGKGSSFTLYLPVL